jgi:hypothetical protein
MAPCTPIVFLVLSLPAQRLVLTQLLAMRVAAPFSVQLLMSLVHEAAFQVW